MDKERFTQEKWEMIQASIFDVLFNGFNGGQKYNFDDSIEFDAVPEPQASQQSNSVIDDSYV